ncbi:MAG: hypothetical protein FJ319_14600 [SAR202 cluster bacterium]|nr:hypothetical protein [SAR202 cluster bacterium]
MSTQQYITRLTSLKEGELTLLRSLSGKGLDETVLGFDLFTGVWWPLRAQSAQAPRREVAWLVAKLFASYPIPNAVEGAEISRLLSRIEPEELKAKRRYRARFDKMLTLPLAAIEPSLAWALATISASKAHLNWARLTDDLSIWERDSTRAKWAEQYVENL